MGDGYDRAKTADGQTFVYRDVGTGPVVVLQHGFPDTPATWGAIADRVAAAGHRVVVPWLRGYHPETVVPKRRYDAVTIGEDLIRFLDALGEQAAVLVGHDWGASMVFAAASLAPERVRGIVPIAVPHPSLVARSPQLAWAVRHFVALRMPWAERSVARNDFAYLDTLYRRWSPRWTGPERDESLARAKACFADRDCLTGALAYYRAISLRIPASLAKPPRTTALAVSGTADVFPAALTTKTAEALGPGSEALLVDQAGHWAHREGEEQFTSALLGFLERLSA